MSGKSFEIAAGQRKRVLWLLSSSMVGEVRFVADTMDGTSPTGQIELVRRHWLFAHRTQLSLERANTLKKRYGDFNYRVYVKPDQDCRITFETRHFRAELFFIVLAFVAILGLAAGLMPFMLRAL